MFAKVITANSQDTTAGLSGNFGSVSNCHGNSRELGVHARDRISLDPAFRLKAALMSAKNVSSAKLLDSFLRWNCMGELYAVFYSRNFIGTRQHCIISLVYTSSANFPRESSGILTFAKKRK